MNTFQTTISRMLRNAALLSLVVLIAASCRKEDHNSGSSGASNLALVHASPGKVAYDVKLNGRRINPGPFTYGNYYNYASVPSGSAIFTITSGTNIVVARDSFSLRPCDAYSLYVTNIPTKVSLLLTEDDLSAPAPGKAKVRFINLNPDAGPLNLNYLGDTTTLFSNIPFKSNTAFIQVTPATGIGFAITDSTGKNVLATSVKYRIDQGGIYTIVGKGARSATDTATAAIGVIVNH
jgi:hypothetical protein